MSMTTSDADLATSPENVTLGPDWLRSKPVAVFSKNRYGQEELFNLWTSLSACPASIIQTEGLGAAEPLRPACVSRLSTDTDNQEQRGGSTQERSRSALADRGRGRGGVNRGGEGRSRYFEKKTTDTDNWRRREPSPEPEEPGVETPPVSYPPFPVKGFSPPPPVSYPPFPVKGFSPPRIDDREANSWKRTEVEASPNSWKRSEPHVSPPFQESYPPSSLPSAPQDPPHLQRGAPQDPPHLQRGGAQDPPHLQRVIPETSHSQRVIPETSQRVIPDIPHLQRSAESQHLQRSAESQHLQRSAESQPRESQFHQDASHETALRSIGQSLQGAPGEGFNSHVVFPPFPETSGSRIFPGAENAPFQATSDTIPFSAPSTIKTEVSSSLELSTSLDMPLFNRDPVGSPSTFPSLADIGKSLNTNVDAVLDQGFKPPVSTQTYMQPPPGDFSSVPSLFKPSQYNPDEMWFYLDPKGNEQGPFDSVKMFGWFKEGYFGMDLEIRRQGESNFTKLQTMISGYERIPFQPEDVTPADSPLETSRAPATLQPRLETSHVPVSSPFNPQPPLTNNAWKGGMWDSETGSFGVPTSISQDQEIENERKLKAMEMRREIERAMAMELELKKEQEKQLLQQKVDQDNYLMQQRQLMETKLAEDAKHQEEELRRIREDEMRKAQLIAEENERMRLEKERLETDRLRQVDQVRIQLHEAQKAREALAAERLKLDKEREQVQQKELELKRKEEADRKRREEARNAEQLRAARQAAEEAKAIAMAQEEAKIAAAREAKAKQAKKEEQARLDDLARRQSEELAMAKAVEAARRDSKNAVNPWGSSDSSQENKNPWANIPPQHVTKAATRTPAPSTKRWGKPDAAPVPLAKIQQDEARAKKSNPGLQTRPVELAKQTGWATQASKPAAAKTLAEIQREEERRCNQVNNYNHAQQNNWNPVAGMLGDEPPLPKKQAPKQKQSASKQSVKQKQPAKPAKKAQSSPLDLFGTSEPKDEFMIWCEKQVASFKNPHIDVSTFIMFLRDVESPREVREYVVSYLGDTLATDKFIQEFLAGRKGTAAGGAPVPSNTNTNKEVPKNPLPGAAAAPKRNKRKKMQKVNASSLLGINCTASSDARNRGDIDTVDVK